MILIGSRALEILVRRMGKDFYRPCVDLDYLCTEAEWEEQAEFFKGEGLVKLVERNGNKGHVEMVAGAHIEYDIAQPGDSTEALIKYCEERKDDLVGMFDDRHSVAPLEVLYLLKMSHRYKKNSPHVYLQRSWQGHHF